MAELFLLGGLDLRGFDGESILSVLTHPKRVAVLAYLTLGAPRGYVSRDRLVSVFWPESDETHARNALSQVLHWLRRSLGEGVILTRGNHDVGVSADHLSCDAVAFTLAVEDGDHEKAIELYLGDLLQGFHLPGEAGFDEWASMERQRLRSMAARSGWVLAHLFLDRNQLPAAEAAAQRAMTLRCTDEAEVRRFIRALAEAGDRAGAVKFYEVFEQKLSEELDLRPDELSQRLMEEIRTSTEISRPHRQATGESPAPPQNPLGGPEKSRKPATAPTAGMPPARRSGRFFTIIARIGLTLAALAVLLFGARSILFVGPGGQGESEIIIAVLPFDDSSRERSDTLLALGVADELRSKLGGIPGLTVVSRNSMEEYRDPAKRTPIQRIAGDLGADFLVEGSIWIEGDSVHLRAHLIRGEDGVQRGSMRFSMLFSTGNFYRLETQLAQRIAHDLRVPIPRENLKWLEAVPTGSLEALEVYLKGNEAFQRDLPYFRSALANPPAVAWYDSAVVLDPSFALAHARLALALTYTLYDETRLERARVAAERALSLTNGLPEAHVALARYYGRKGETEKANRAVNLAFELAPEDSDVLQILAERQWASGNFEAAVQSLVAAETIDPRNPVIPHELGGFFQFLHRFDEALEAFYRAASRSETPPPTWMEKRAIIHILKGEAVAARAAIRELLDASPETPYGLVPTSLNWAYLRFMSPAERQVAFAAFTEANLEEGVNSPCTRLSTYCFRRAIHEEEVGSPEAARILWDSLRVVIEAGARPSERWDYASGAMVLLKAGEVESALQWAQEGVDRFAPNGCRADRFANDVCTTLARFLALAGKPDRAIDLIEKMLPAPSAFTVHLLEFDPIWDPVRDHPRFEALLVKYADDVEH